jgi:hypothetical protein
MGGQAKGVAAQVVIEERGQGCQADASLAQEAAAGLYR